MRRRNSSASSSSSTYDLVAPLVTLLGLYLFITSFFLAKRSLPQTSTCDEADTLLQETLGLTTTEIQLLQQKQILSSSSSSLSSSGCWMNQRKVDSMVMIVIDALRFDFALHHLPKSVGARLQPTSANGNNTSSYSKLFQFVADPPTVTMQRLKALTTGGLPTFADISGNMGGASLDEDTWIQQLRETPHASRNLSFASRIAFVGDDTWLDLFPKSFDEAFPYPSFNTRDLDTVDNGCLHHIPTLLSKLRRRPKQQKQQQPTKQEQEELEVVIVHFLGVDHVGHTYGPHNEHMDTKLKQMDEALTEILEFMDHGGNKNDGSNGEEDDSCSVALIFGDHGMTEDGNHGGGSDEEINAALFVHFSPACHRNRSSNSGGFNSNNKINNLDSMTREVVEGAGGEYAQTVFTSIHQIDLVPTISILLGLPIPYANLGSLVPSLALLDNPFETATALALNAAQVWRYFTMYSTTANQLPGLQELEERLQQALRVWKDGLSHTDGDDSTIYMEACTLFKMFLMEALQLGQRVWTRFDTNGMAMGGFVILVGIVLWCIPLVRSSYYYYHHGNEDTDDSNDDGRRLVPSPPPPGQIWELLLTALFIVFSCGILTFGNSYILEEEHVCMFMIGILGFVLSIRLALTTTTTVTSSSQRITAISNLQRYAPLIIPIASRVGELFVTGHGQDPSVRAHNAHHPAIFLSSVVLLIASRWYLNTIQFTPSFQHALVDCLTLACLGQSWWEKRQTDPERHGFPGTRLAIAMVLIGLPISLYQANNQQQQLHGKAAAARQDLTKLSSSSLGSGVTVIIKLLLLIMIVTGPSSATSMALFSAQATAIFLISRIAGPAMIPSAVLAALWRFIIRHVFFATNHGCTFSRLQLSAAFVATSTFNFAFAGSSLFINTFGWEIVGLSFAWLLSSSSSSSSLNNGTTKNSNRFNLWRWYCLYQMIETLCSCISVSVLRRHLMVWDIYAPHFMFVAIFMILFAAFQLLVCYYGYRSNIIS